MPTLHWIGKEKVVNHHQDVPFRVLEHQYGFDANKGESEKLTDSGNKIIHGDNLEALKSLLPEYEGKVKCIYIDPPYNTGNESWVYNDNVNHPKIKKWLGEVVGKEGDDLSRHDKWLCMMYPRLKLLHKLLADDGVIFVSIDDNEQAKLRIIMDEIFGGKNFLGNIVWKKKTNGNNMGHIPPVHDFIVAYAKHEDKLDLPGARYSQEYISQNYSNPDNDPRGPWTTSDLSANHEGPYFPITNPETKEVHYPPKGRYWVFNEAEVKKRIDDGRIIFGKSGTAKPVQKAFLKDKVLRKKPETWWDNKGYNSDGMEILSSMFGGKVLQHPKPPSLIEFIVDISTNENDIVLDSFAGSGTTAQAVLNLNKLHGGSRKFILIELEDYAGNITAERVKKVIEGYEFEGNKKEVLKRFSINITNLKKASDIVDTYEEYKADSGFDKVVIDHEEGEITIVGTKKISDKIEGIGGEFDFYQLGQPLFDENELLNEEVEEVRIREYVWYSETKSAFPKERNKNEHKHLLGTKDETDYYFYYEKEAITTLNHDFLATITQEADQYVIYADNCLLSRMFMRERNIIFKKIPRDVTRF
jgi:adenine-specific DNA-methyltransferase